MRAVPRELRAKLEPAELYHEVLEHRWYLSEQRGHDVGLTEAVATYVAQVLPHKRDESSLITTETAEQPVVEGDPVQGDPIEGER